VLVVDPGGPDRAGWTVTARLPLEAASPATRETA
jgi:hypothetical protein